MTIAMADLTNPAREWQRDGDLLDGSWGSMFYRDTGQGRPLVLLHGFPTSSWDWHLLLPQLSHRRILCMDLPGFGLSAKPPERDYSLLRQADAVEELLQARSLERFDLLAHDMGASLACELLYRQSRGQTPYRIERLALLNAGLYMDLHQPLITQRLLRTPLLGRLTARLSSYRVFRHQFGKVYADGNAFDELHYRSHWQLMLYGGGRRVLHKTAGYMRERLRYHQRWLGSLEQSSIPLAVLWGMRDPIAVPAIADRLEQRCGSLKIQRLPDVGHYPQLEAPGTVAAFVDRYLN